MGSHRRSVVAAMAIVALATLAAVGSAAAAGATMRIMPASQTVAKGASFTVRVVENNAGPTIGTQVTVTFDRTKAQITAVTWGAPFANAPVLIPTDMAGAIAQANSTGKLHQLAASFLAPTDSVPAGDADVLSITFNAIACGNIPLGLPVGPYDASMLDGNEATVGNTLPVTTSGGSVTVDCGGAASSSASPTASSADSPTPTASSADSPTPGASSADSPTPGASAEATPTDAPPVDEGASAEASSAASPVPGAASSSSGPGGGPPIWLPLALSIPAIAIVGLGLLRWRQTATVLSIPDRH